MARPTLRPDFIGVRTGFGEAQVIIDGALCKAHYLVVDLPYSDAYYVKAYPAETTEAFCDGHNWAFSFFGGVPQSMLYDNTKLAVARILGNGKRKLTRVFSEVLSHYLFDTRFGRPGKGNDKGKVPRFHRGGGLRTPQPLRSPTFFPELRHPERLPGCPMPEAVGPASERTPFDRWGAAGAGTGDDD